MSKLITGIVVIGVIVVGAVALTGRDDRQHENNEDVMMEEGKIESEDFTGSIKDLFLAGKDVTCDFSHTNDFGTTEGTIYVKAGDEKFRGDFTIEQTDVGTFESHIINEKTVGYTWGSSPYGEVAIKFPILEELSDSDSSEDTFDPDQEVDYKCRAWKVDESKFTPPSDVQFMDFTTTGFPGV